MTAKRQYPVLVCLLLSFCLTRFFFGYFGFSEHFMFFLPFMVLLAAGIRSTLRKSDRNLAFFSGIFAVLLSLSWILGDKIDTGEKVMGPVERSDLLPFILLALTFFFASAGLAIFIRRHSLPPARGKPGTVFWLLCTGTVLLAWFPFLLIYYPGNISWDSLSCIVRATGEAVLSNQQPVFYILLMKPFLMMGTALRDINFGIALFLFFQMAFMAGTVGYLTFWLRKRGCSAVAVLLVLLFFALNPIFGMYAVTLWKDVPFGGLILLYSLELFEIAESGGERLKTRRGLFGFLALTLLVCFMRNNGYYIAAAILVVLFIMYRKSWKRWVLAFLPVLILVPVIQGPVYTACGIQLSPFAESVGIPLQQMGRTVKKDGIMTKRQKKFLDRLLPLEDMKRAYDPLTSNGIKFQKNFDNVFLARHKLEFFETWAGMMFPNQSEYAKAYLMETVGYWHIGTKDWYLFFGVGEGYGAQDHGIASSDLLSRAAGTDLRQSLQDHVKRWEETPVVSDFNNIGFLFWTAAFSALAVFAEKNRRRRLISLLPLLFLWGTLMLATPTYCEFRYMFAFLVSLPFMIVLPFLPVSGRGRGNQNKNTFPKHY